MAWDHHGMTPEAVRCKLKIDVSIGMASPADRPEDSAITQTLNWIVKAGVDGLGILPSAEMVARDHMKATGDTEKAINSIIAWRTTQGAATGFVSGVGGIAALPVAIPASLIASYALAANTAAAIAFLRGYDISSDQVRTFVVLCLIGESGEEILKAAGIAIGTKLSKALIEKIPGTVFIQINKQVGFRLITKAGSKGVINMTKMIPLVGGAVGAGFDGAFVNGAGTFAKKTFTALL